jgi:2-keto-myo-inositol isomerase
MKNSSITRRKFITGSTAAAAGIALSGTSAVSDVKSERYQNGRSPWPVSLDTSTIRPAGDISEKVRIAAEAGYDGIEPWEGELSEYEERGGDLRDLGQRIKDSGMGVPNVVALWNAIPPTQQEWEEREEEHRNRFRQASETGAKYIQTVLTPAREWQEYDLNFAAEKFHELLEMGINDYNVIPALNFLQFLPHNQRIGQASAIALNADHPEAKIIPDTFHMYAGGSGFNGLKHIRGSFIAIFQINDVPGNPPREELEDEHRVYPGDGIFPLTDILKDLKETGFDEFVSLQLFNPDYWEQDLLEVARTGLEKTVSVIEAAGV